MSEMQNKAIDVATFGVAKSSLSFEEFKKSLVRIASLCAVSTKTAPSHDSQDLQQLTLSDEHGRDDENWKEASGLTGGTVPGEQVQDTTRST